MSKIKGKNTRPEKIFRKCLRQVGLSHYVLNLRIIGSPDIAFKTEKVAIFVDGKFWHGYAFRKWSKKLAPFWLTKISENIKRDSRVNRQLKKLGWKVMRFWDFQVLNDPAACVRRVASIVKKP